MEYIKPLKLAGLKSGLLYQNRKKIVKLNDRTFNLSIRRIVEKHQRIVLTPLPSSIKAQKYYDLEDIYGFSYKGNIHLMLVFYFLDEKKEGREVIAAKRKEVHFSNIKIQGSYFNNEWDGNLNYIDPSPIYYQTFDATVAVFFQSIVEKKIGREKDYRLIKTFPYFLKSSYKKIFNKSKL